MGCRVGIVMQEHTEQCFSHWRNAEGHNYPISLASDLSYDAAVARKARELAARPQCYDAEDRAPRSKTFRSVPIWCVYYVSGGNVNVLMDGVSTSPFVPPD